MALKEVVSWGMGAISTAWDLSLENRDNWMMDDRFQRRKISRRYVRSVTHCSFRPISSITKPGKQNNDRDKHRPEATQKIQWLE
jgi:hypothetical protein